MNSRVGSFRPSVSIMKAERFSGSPQAEGVTYLESVRGTPPKRRGTIRVGNGSLFVKSTEYSDSKYLLQNP